MMNDSPTPAKLLNEAKQPVIEMMDAVTPNALSQSPVTAFVSAVTHDFESAFGPNPQLRSQLKFYLSRRSIFARIQEELPQSDDDLLTKLFDVIRQCDSACWGKSGRNAAKRRCSKILEYASRLPSWVS